MNENRKFEQKNNKQDPYHGMTMDELGAEIMTMINEGQAIVKCEKDPQTGEKTTITVVRNSDGSPLYFKDLTAFKSTDGDSV